MLSPYFHKAVTWLVKIAAALAPFWNTILANVLEILKLLPFWFFYGNYDNLEFFNLGFFENFRFRILGDSGIDYWVNET